MTEKQVEAFNKLIDVVNEALESEKKSEEKFTLLKKELDEYISEHSDMFPPYFCRGCGTPLNNYCPTCQKDLES
jgi:rubrerythrin